MECSGVLVEKFMKFLSADDIKKDEMKVPNERSKIQASFLLKFRNGYEKRVVFNKDRGTLYGPFPIFYDFNFKGGEMLVFEFNGSLSVHNGGLKFVRVVRDEDPLFDEFEPPYSFKKALPMLLGYQYFVFRLDNFRQFNVVLFSYEDNDVTTVSVFDDHFVEVIFPGTPVSMGLNSGNSNVHGRIEINVQACHMYKCSYGVDVSTQYDSITNLWSKTDYISVYSGDRAWKLQVRTRPGNLKRTTIMDGWIQFRDDLGLEAGDVIVLECALASFHHFSVGVLKYQGA
ncbi:hypothetical protein DCAR_0519890 [Daucus carota subsp. sativus]|uniref:Uncharacterized protein n=1 Tax=Daucus carota subsp. sativus TaxID=79200 RepID=A0A164Y9Q6_DAUCS|nr:hypothetical protein DCAR_0519890 [Daucus carota subsp. sativus]